MNWYIYACLSVLVYVRIMFSDIVLKVLLVIDGTPKALVAKLALLALSFIVGFIAYALMTEIKKWWRL